MSLSKSQDLFTLSTGDIVTKRNLFDLIQYSKVEASQHWSGEDFIIGNTPQQGINWIGQIPTLKAVIIKTRPGTYKEDGWLDELKTIYHYSFKARNSEISYKEKANRILISQPQYQYPIFLFTECLEGWMFQGVFSVSGIEEKYVVLNRGMSLPAKVVASQDELKYFEGGRRYVTHLMAERSNGVVKALKDSNLWLCEICSLNFNDRYGVMYIEAHHKVPISTYSTRYSVNPEDFALLCPNCHKAVHMHMKNRGMDYDEIKVLLLKQ